MSQTLFSITWFLRAGCNAIFTGRSSLNEKTSGHGEISLQSSRKIQKTTKVHYLYVVLADLHCACTICTESKTEAPSLRKFEGTRTLMSSVTDEYSISTDPNFSNAMDALKKLDHIEQI